MAWVLVSCVVLAALAALWCVWTATRLDRLHLLLDSASAALAAGLSRRSAVATDVALSQTLDPASSLALLDAATAAREADSDDWQVQSDLSAVIRTVSDVGTEDGGRLARASREVAIARRIHNDIVARAQDLHGRRRVRWFRLAGHASRPVTIEFDDSDDAI